MGYVVLNMPNHQVPIMGQRGCGLVYNLGLVGEFEC
jgi:hypothetical protein